MRYDDNFITEIFREAKERGVIKDWYPPTRFERVWVVHSWWPTTIPIGKVYGHVNVVLASDQWVPIQLKANREAWLFAIALASAMTGMSTMEVEYVDGDG